MLDSWKAPALSLACDVEFGVAIKKNRELRMQFDGIAFASMYEQNMCVSIYITEQKLGGGCGPKNYGKAVQSL